MSQLATTPALTDTAVHNGNISELNRALSQENTAGTVALCRLRWFVFLELAPGDRKKEQGTSAAAQGSGTRTTRNGSIGGLGSKPR